MYDIQRYSLDDLPQALPQCAGVYAFCQQDSLDHCLYIGKSIHLRDRVMSHVYSKEPREQRIMRSTRTIMIMPTTGEFSALLYESEWVKQYCPLYNKKLRRARSLFTLALTLPDDSDYLTAKITPMKNISSCFDGQHYGLFTRREGAVQCLQSLVKQHHLCSVRLGLEKARTPCFNFQIKRCQGACIERESATAYNQRLREILANSQLTPWPFPGAIRLVERCYDSGYTATHQINQWVYEKGAIMPLMAESDSSRHQPLTLSCQSAFNRDAYHIIRNAVKQAPLSQDIWSTAKQKTSSHALFLEQI